MISLYTGSVGSGKSYHALSLALDWCVKGKNVIANFPVKPPSKFHGKRHEKYWQRILSRWDFQMEFTPELLIAKSFENEWFGKESQCLVVIDEAGILFNSRDWQTAAGSRKKWIQFLSQSRKFGYDFVFVCQSDRMIDRQIRGLVEYEVRHRKANNSFFLSWLSWFKISLFLYVYKWYGTKVKANMRMDLFKPWIANKYDTMRIFNLDELIESMESMYAGKVIPAPVALQLQRMKEEEDARKEFLEQRRKEQEEKEKQEEDAG